MHRLSGGRHVCVFALVDQLLEVPLQPGLLEDDVHLLGERLGVGKHRVGGLARATLAAARHGEGESPFG